MNEILAADVEAQQPEGTEEEVQSVDMQGEGDEARSQSPPADGRRRGRWRS